MSHNAQPPLIVIVGPTASGKTDLAVQLASQCSGEIICADSRTIYRGMDIGTAKPTAVERQLVPHWGLDLVDPEQPFSVADFKKYAEQKIIEIRKRGHVPFLVGGTGLYIDAVVFDYQFGAVADSTLREKLGSLSSEELHQYCIENNILISKSDTNKRHLTRIIERQGTKPSKRERQIDDCVIVGIATDKLTLKTRITTRTEHLFENGVVEEAMLLGKKYGWDNNAMTGNIYPLLKLYLENEYTLKETKEKFTTLDWRLAKRQMTWLRRNPFIIWHSIDTAEQMLSQVLVNH